MDVTNKIGEKQIFELTKIDASSLIF